MLYAKAIVAGVIAACGTLATALSDSHITAAEWISVVLTTAIAAGGVFGVRNAQPPVTPSLIVPDPTPGQD